MDSANLPLYTAGHVHVGGLIDWDTAREATKVTLREVIKYVDYFKKLPGDINDDSVVSILDMIMILSHILNYNNLSEIEFEIANINFDGEVDIFDIMILINAILSNNQSNYNADFNQDNSINVLDVVILVDIALNN